MPKLPRSSERPNLLLITTDQQRWDALSLIGKAGYRTPNLDRLARRGVAFDNAYAPTPVCTPCRVSMLTGLYPPSHGAYQIGMDEVPALKRENLPSILAANGYRTACIGKTHFVARKLEKAHVAYGDASREQPPEEFWDTFDGPYWGFEFLRHNAGHTSSQTPGEHYRSWLKRKGADLARIDSLHQPLLPKTEGCPMHVGKWDLPEEYSNTAFVTEEGIKWISAQDGPWFAMLNYQDPHAPFSCPEPWFGAVDMSGVEIMGLRPGEMDDKPPFYKSLVEDRGYLDERGNSLQDEFKLASLWTYRFGEHTRDAVRAYIGMVNMLDAYIGKVLDHLEASGQADNTLIVFTSDHGEHLGNHGLWEKGICAYDDSQRVPAILSWPKAALPEHGLVSHHFNLVDIMPTFLSAAGIEVPVGVQGFDYSAYLRGDRSAVRDWSFCDFYGSSKLHQQTLVTGDYKLVLYRHQNWGELYDRKKDPEQLVNLYDKPEYAKIRADLTHRLVQINMESSGVQGKRKNYA